MNECNWSRAGPWMLKRVVDYKACRRLREGSSQLPEKGLAWRAQEGSDLRIWELGPWAHSASNHQVQEGVR